MNEAKVVLYRHIKVDFGIARSPLATDGVGQDNMATAYVVGRLAGFWSSIGGILYQVVPSLHP